MKDVEQLRFICRKGNEETSSLLVGFTKIKVMVKEPEVYLGTCSTSTTEHFCENS